MLLAALALLAPGCRHKPVEAGYGAAYIDCDLPRTEILIDGQMTHRFTPAQIGGIPAGVRQVRLRHINCSSLRRTVTIRPNVLERFRFVMQGQVFQFLSQVAIPGACDAVSDPAAGLAWVSTRGDRVCEVRFDDSALALQRYAVVPCSAAVLAADPRSAYLCCLGTLSDGAKVLATIDRGSLSLAGQNSSATVQGLADICFSPDGSRLIGADPAGRRLVSFDPATAALTGTADLGMAPDHIGAGPDGRFYAASLAPPLLARVDPATGATAGSAPLGARPDGFRCDAAGRRAAVWDKANKVVMIVDLANWAVADCPLDVGGDSLMAVHWTEDDDYLLALLMKEMPDGTHSSVTTVYTPEWTACGQLTTVSFLRRMLPTANPSRTMVLDASSGALHLLRTGI